MWGTSPTRCFKCISFHNSLAEYNYSHSVQWKSGQGRLNRPLALRRWQSRAQPPFCLVPKPRLFLIHQRCPDSWIPWSRNFQNRLGKEGDLHKATGHIFCCAWIFKKPQQTKLFTLIKKKEILTIKTRKDHVTNHKYQQMSADINMILSLYCLQ